MKDMFYYSGLPSEQDYENGKCAKCPMVDMMDMTCTETSQYVGNTVRSGRINHSCPFTTK